MSYTVKSAVEPSEDTELPAGSGAREEGRREAKSGSRDGDRYDDPLTGSRVTASSCGRLSFFIATAIRASDDASKK